jgi:hypothetical protein
MRKSKIIDADILLGRIDMRYDYELAEYESSVRLGHALDVMGFPGRDYDFLKQQRAKSRNRT